MEKEKTHSNGGNSWDIDLIEFSVVLVAAPIDPSILNPDFLQHNEIVDARWQVQEPRISTPAFSQATFTDGLTVTADPERVIFAQSGNSLSPEDIACPEIAKRYVEQVPHIYRAVGINPKGRRRSDGEAIHRVADALIDKGAWMSFKDVTPDVQLKAIYRYPRRTISLDIIEAQSRTGGRGVIPGMLFQANIHHDITETNPQARISALLSIINSWREGLSDFRAIVAKFDLER